MAATAQQTEALAYLDAFVAGYEMVGVLKGYAGVGKTELDHADLRKLLDTRKPLNLLAPLRHAYACTVHKSQGSTYDVAFIDFSDMYRSEDRAKLMYVAVTRTSNFLVIAEG